MAATAEEVKKHIKIYLFVLGALALLTIVTVVASLLEVSVVAAVVLAMMIASLKGSLVASFFMHLTSERAALYWLLILCVVLFAALLALPVLQTSETAGLSDLNR